MFDWQTVSTVIIVMGAAIFVAARAWTHIHEFSRSRSKASECGACRGCDGQVKNSSSTYRLRTERSDRVEVNELRK